MSKYRKTLTYITLPFIGIGLIMIIITAVFGFITESFSENTTMILAIISISILGVGAICYGVFLPLVRSKEQHDYEKEVSTDFSDITPLDYEKTYLLLGFEMLVKVQENGLYFQQLKKTIPYSDLDIAIVHRNFYGHKENYFKIKVNQEKYKKFPKTTFIAFDRNLLAVLEAYHVSINHLEQLDPHYKQPKMTQKCLKKYTYPIKYLLIKIAITVALIAVAIILMIRYDSEKYLYIGILPCCLIWMNNSKSGSLYLYEDRLILKKHFVKTVIEYEDILDVSIKDNRLYVISTLDFMQFDSNLELLEELRERAINS